MITFPVQSPRYLQNSCLKIYISDENGPFTLSRGTRVNRTQLRWKIQAVADTVKTAKTGCPMSAALAVLDKPCHSHSSDRTHGGVPKVTTLR